MNIYLNRTSENGRRKVETRDKVGKIEMEMELEKLRLRE